MGSRRSVRSGVLLLLWAGGLGSLWLLYGVGARNGGLASGPDVEAAAAVAVAGSLDVERVTASARALPPPVSDLDDPAPPADPELAQREPGRIKEKEFYEGFLRQARESGGLEDVAADLLRGEGPDPQKVALLRALWDLGSERRAEFWLLAVRELPDVSDAQGESVPSTALLLLDRRGARDPQSRAVLRGAAFGAPRPPSNLRRRAAASFFLQATADELLAARADLARETDPLFLECALEALSRNANTGQAAILLAAHGRPPPEPFVEVQEP